MQERRAVDHGDEQLLLVTHRQLHRRRGCGRFDRGGGIAGVRRGQGGWHSQRDDRDEHEDAESVSHTTPVERGALRGGHDREWRRAAYAASLMFTSTNFWLSSGPPFGNLRTMLPTNRTEISSS